MQPFPWQHTFLKRMTESIGQTTALTGSTGTGKTTAAILLIRELLDRRLADVALVLTSDRCLSEEYLGEAARNAGLRLASGLYDYRNGDKRGLCATGRSLNEPQCKEYIRALAQHQAMVVITEDVHLKSHAAYALVDELLAANPANKALFVFPDVPVPPRFDAYFTVAGGFLAHGSTIASVEIETRLARLPPGYVALRKLAADISRIDEMSWRQFERLIVTLLERGGYEVRWIGGSGDGGVDILAIGDFEECGPIKVAVQVKKRHPQLKVGVSVIRELADATREFRASKGVVVTSSYLTRPALARVEENKYTLGKVDRDDLRTWICRTASP